MTHSTKFSGGARHCSAKAPGGEDLEMQESILRGDFATVHFSPTLPGMPGSTLIRDQVVEVRSPGEKHLLAALRMMKRFHHEQLPLDSVMRLIQQGAGHRPPGIFKDRIPARLLVLQPAPHPFTIGCPCHAGDMIGKVA